MTPELITAIINIGYKVYQDLTAGDPVDITAEISALEAARLKSSQEIIDAADKGV